MLPSSNSPLLTPSRLMLSMAVVIISWACRANANRRSMRSARPTGDNAFGRHGEAIAQRHLGLRIALLPTVVQATDGTNVFGLFDGWLAVLWARRAAHGTIVSSHDSLAPNGILPL